LAPDLSTLTSPMALLRHASTVALLTLGSRTLGFVRDAMVAALFGTGIVADAGVAGLALPQLARRLLGEGALNAAILPRLPKDGIGRLGTAALILFGAASIALAVVLFIFMPSVITLLAPGFPDDGARELGAVLAGRLAVVCVPLATIAGVLAALANASGRFARPSFAPVAGNIAVIAVVLGLYLSGAHEMAVTAGLVWLALATVAGAVTQLIVILAAVPRGTLGPASRQAIREALPMLTAAAPTLMATALPQLRFIIAASAASGITGGIAALFYATRLIELPLGLIGASTGAVLLPALATREKSDIGHRGVEAALALSLPAALGLAVLAQPIVAVLFQRGAFDLAATQLTAAALAMLALTLPLQAVEKILAAIAFAQGFSRLVTTAALIALPLGAVIGFLTAGPLGIAGPALGVLASSVVSLIILWAGLARHGLMRLDPDVRRRLTGLIVAALAMALVVGFGAYFLKAPLDGGGLKGAGLLGLLVMLGMAVYFTAARTLGGLHIAALRAALRD